MSGALVIAGGCIFVLMGCTHGLLSVVDVFRPTQFAPADDSVRVAMMSTRVRFLKARASMWDAWLGFNISHSLGMFVFGAACTALGWNIEHAAVTPPPPLLLVPLAIAAVYLLLSVRFWFWAPAVASAVATACFAAAWWVC